MTSYGLPYENPADSETTQERKLRRKRMKDAIDQYNEQLQIRSQQSRKDENLKIPSGIDFTIERPLKTVGVGAAGRKIEPAENANNSTFEDPPMPVIECLDFVVNSVSNSVDSENRAENLDYLHSEPEVQEAILRFEESEKKHAVARCVTCREVRPVFHVEKFAKTLPRGRTHPMHGESWKLNKNGQCGNCHKDAYSSKRKSKELEKKKLESGIPHTSVKSAAKYSGIYSTEDDMALDPSNNQILRHNDMHFRKVPPYLQGLTTTETALISKISVLMNVHVLKTGMFASKGHCVSLPQTMNEAKQLPLLPAEVNIVILKRVRADGKIKHYYVKRSVVQNALEGLCFGYPHGGSDERNDLCQEKYTGRDHVQMPLHGRYFQHIPNPFYNDVEIMYDRLNELPEESSLWSGLTVIERPDNEFDSNVEHPVNPEEPVDITHSGLIRPLKPSENDDANIY